MTTAPPAPPSTGGGAAPLAPPDPSPVVRSSHRVRYAVVGLVLVGALVFLVAKGIGTALNFYLPADQAVAQEASLGDKTFNLEGVVEPGSVHQTAVGVDFVVTSGAAKVTVDNTGTPPELFQAQHPGDRRRPLRRPGVRLGPDPGEALVRLHRQVPGPGYRTERHQAMRAGPGHRQHAAGTHQ